MAAKKTAKKTTEASPKDSATTPKPVAKKATKTPKKVAADADAPAAKEAIPAAAPAARKAAAKPSLDAIARAAYLNYRRRVEKGLPGDSHGDWLEAERQSS